MGGGGLIGFLIVGLLVVYPFYRILPRVGINPWFCLAAFIPVGAVVLLWVVAFRPWDSAR